MDWTAIIKMMMELILEWFRNRPPRGEGEAVKRAAVIFSLRKTADELEKMG